MPARKKVIKKEEEESKPEVRLETAVEGTPASSTTDEYAATSVTELGKASAGSVPEVAHAVTVGDLARVTEPEAVTSAPAVTTATPSTTQMPVVMPEVEMAIKRSPRSTTEGTIKLHNSGTSTTFKSMPCFFASLNTALFTRGLFVAL